MLYGPGEAADDPGSYGAGTTGTSHYIFWDPLEQGSHDSSFTFDAPVIAILWSTQGLADTDASLGLAGVTYGGAFGARGFEDPPPDDRDTVFLSNGRRTLDFKSRAGTPGDWFRVVTAEAPAPGSGLLIVLGLGALGFTRKRLH